MRKKQILKAILSLILCLAMVLPSNLAMSTIETVQAAPIISNKNLLVNGSFADEDGDGKADGWEYFKGSVTEAASSIGEDGITVKCDSTNENQRLTVHQTVTGLAAGKYVFKGMVQAPDVSKGGVRVYETVTGGARNKFYETLKPVAEWTPFEQEIIVEKDGDTIKDRP